MYFITRSLFFTMGMLSFVRFTLANDLVDLSRAFLQTLRMEEDAARIVERYAALDYDMLRGGLDDRAEKLAFWVNTYNGFVIHILRNDPASFEKKGRFYADKRIRIAGIDFSLDDIEHGIIRNSRVKWGLGYLRKWYVPRHIRELQIRDTDSRIHFALNCGAVSCPPVAVYEEDTVFRQFDENSRQYLQTVTDVVGDQVVTSPLFSWFRGDFGGKSGIVKMLTKYEIVPAGQKLRIKYGQYDWTMQIGTFTDL